MSTTITRPASDTLINSDAGMLHASLDPTCERVIYTFTPSRMIASGERLRVWIDPMSVSAGMHLETPGSSPRLEVLAHGAFLDVEACPRFALHLGGRCVPHVSRLLRSFRVFTKGASDGEQ